jgi:hypothetical protein
LIHAAQARSVRLTQTAYDRGVTTLTRSRRNDNVLIWFFALVAAGIAVRLAFAGNTVATAIFGVLAVSLIGFSLWLRSQPPLQMRIETAEIVLASPKRELGRINRQDTGGSVVISGVIRRGHLYAFLAAPGATPWSGLPLDGFDGTQVGEACIAHGWTVERTGT